MPNVESLSKYEAADWAVHLLSVSNGALDLSNDEYKEYLEYTTGINGELELIYALDRFIEQWERRYDDDL